MDIDKQIEKMALTVSSDIDALSPKDRLNYYQTLMEFRTPKLQRSSFVTDAKLPEHIKIEIVTNED